MSQECLDQLQREVDLFVALVLRADQPVWNYNLVAGRLHQMVMAILACEQEEVPKESILEVLAPARKYHSDSPFIWRCQHWPRGFPGDYETIGALYFAENRATPHTLAYYCEEYALLCASTQQHRNKLRFQGDLILQRLFQSNEPIRVLSLAGGNCIDLQAILPALVGKPVSFVLNDTDPDALADAREKLASMAEQCTFYEGNVIEFLAWEADEIGAFDLVLTGGLFDYLEEKHILYLLRYLKKGLLRPGGTFFFTNVAKHNPYRPWMEYLADWVLIERDEDELMRILHQEAGIPKEQIQISRDLTRVTCLAQVTIP